MKALDITGQTYHRLLVVSRAGNNDKNRPIYVCRCECGSEIVVTQASLRKGNTKSCGCLRREVAAEKATTHGLNYTAEHKVWSAMKSRCTNPNNKMYKYYGGKGVGVCQRWSESFEAFIKDMGMKPFPKAEIDRLDSGGMYEKSNCRWATRAEQMRNYSRNVVLAYNGQSMTMVEWAEKLSLSYAALTSRIYRGWTVERALTEPLRGGSR